MSKGNLIIISSPSGGGKGTLIKELLDSIPDIGYSVSYTTRERRFGEENGRDYHFITIPEFTDKIEANEFLEHAEVHGNYYGTSLYETERMLNAGRDVILEIDVQGALQVMKKVPGAATSIFILPPSYEVLRARLTARSTETAEDLSLRLRNAFDEVEQYTRFDYVVVNDDLRIACRNLAAIILAERQTRVRQTDCIKGIIGSFEMSKHTNSGE
jgi:guanylate kinase